jgi:hypothetical protein
MMSATAFDWAVSAITFALAGPWIFYDGWNLVRLRKADSSDLVVRDKRFGYVIGMMIGVIGVIGVAKHHLG